MPETVRQTPVYVINLDRSSDRLAGISAALRAVGLTIERIPAINASELEPAILEQVYDALENRRVTIVTTQ